MSNNKKRSIFGQNWKSKTLYFHFKTMNYFLPKSINDYILDIIFFYFFLSNAVLYLKALVGYTEIAVLTVFKIIESSLKSWLVFFSTQNF